MILWQLHGAEKYLGAWSMMLLSSAMKTEKKKSIQILLTIKQITQWSLAASLKRRVVESLNSKDLLDVFLQKSLSHKPDE